MAEVKNCPRCDGKPECTAKTLIAWVKCPDCGHYVIADTIDEAVSKWNMEQREAGECEACKIN